MIASYLESFVISLHTMHFFTAISVAPTYYQVFINNLSHHLRILRPVHTLRLEVSLLLLLAPWANTLTILLSIVLPIPPTFRHRLSIITQLTWQDYNFSCHNYASMTSSCEAFLESHSFFYHLTDDLPSLCNLLYASWSKYDLTIITWMLQNIKQSIVEYPMHQTNALPLVNP